MNSYVLTVLGGVGTGLTAYFVSQNILASVVAALGFIAGHLFPSPVKP